MSDQEIMTADAVKLDVRVYPLRERTGKAVAVASLTINDCFAVNGVHVVEGSNGLFVAMPNGRDKEGNYRDVCFPTTAELRHQINKAVLDGYQAALEKAPPEKASIGEQLKDAERQSKAKPAKAKSAPDKDAR